MISESIRQKVTRALPLVVALSIVLPVASFAGFFGDHPHYLHALSDLRFARALVEQPGTERVILDEEKAVRELDLSIDEIKQAARDDWKPLSDHPAIDAGMDRRGRFHQALKVLARAHNDICREEDDGAARGLRDRAVGHLDQAMNCIREAMNDKRFGNL